MIGDAPDLRVLCALLALALAAIGYCWGRAQYQLLKLQTKEWEPGRDEYYAEQYGTTSRPEAARGAD